MNCIYCYLNSADQNFVDETLPGTQACPNCNKSSLFPSAGCTFMDDETAVVRYQRSRKVPKPGAKEKTADELLRQFLTKGPRASAEAADKAAQVSELQASIATMPNGAAKNYLQEN